MLLENNLAIKNAQELYCTRYIIRVGAALSFRQVSRICSISALALPFANYELTLYLVVDRAVLANKPKSIILLIRYIKSRSIIRVISIELYLIVPLSPVADRLHRRVHLYRAAELLM